MRLACTYLRVHLLMFAGKAGTAEKIILEYVILAGSSFLLHISVVVRDPCALGLAEGRGM